jgi:hypothetical protein
VLVGVDQHDPATLLERGDPEVEHGPRLAVARPGAGHHDRRTGSGRQRVLERGEHEVVGLPDDTGIDVAG